MAGVSDARMSRCSNELDTLVEERDQLAQSVPHDILLPYVPHRIATPDDVSPLSLPSTRLPVPPPKPVSTRENPTREPTPFDNDDDYNQSGAPMDRIENEPIDARAVSPAGAASGSTTAPSATTPPTIEPTVDATPSASSTISAAASIIPFLAPTVAPLVAPLVSAAVMAAVVAAVTPSVLPLIAPLISPIVSRIATAPILASPLAPFAIASVVAAIPHLSQAEGESGEVDNSNIIKPPAKGRKKRVHEDSAPAAKSKSKSRGKGNAAASGSGSALSDIVNSPIGMSTSVQVTRGCIRIRA